MHRLMSSLRLAPNLLLVTVFALIQNLASTSASEVHRKKSTGNCLKEAYYKNCAELYNCGQTISGIYTIDPDRKGAFNVYCDQTTDGGGWTVFQRRLDGCMDFNLGWADYKKGFGDFLDGEFWLGLEKIHRLTQNETENRLRVDMGVTKRQTVYAEYLWFGIGDKKDKYRLKLGKKSKCATVNDSLSDHKGSPFGTWDKIYKHCTHKIYGGWWYINNTECAVSSNLNGFYHYCKKRKRNMSGTLAERKIHWSNLSGTASKTSPVTSEMKIKPVDLPFKC